MYLFLLGCLTLAVVMRGKKEKGKAFVNLPRLPKGKVQGLQGVTI
jgi:hypothetical protein